MPKYQTQPYQIPPPNPKASSPVTLLNAEAVNAGDSSLQCVLRPGEVNSNTPFGVYMQWASDPGATPSLAVQVADIDADANYVTVANGTITTFDATNRNARFDANAVAGGKFVRVKVVALTTGGTPLTVRVAQ